MRVRLRLDPDGVRGWHRQLIARLDARPGWQVEVEGRPSSRAATLPRSVEHLLALEGILLRRPSRESIRILPDALRPCQPLAPAPDRIIDLTGDAAEAGVWRLVYDGQPGERGLMASLVRRTRPLAELRDGAGTVAAARIGTDAHGDLHRTWAEALERTATLIEAALDGGPAAGPHPEGRSPGLDRPFGTAEAAARLGRRLAGTVGSRWRRRGRPRIGWRVGWRRLSGPDLLTARDHPPDGWTDLPDDGRRFYADPCAIAHDGAVHLFLEEYPYATGKGIISAVRFGPDGPEGKPEPVLERPTHLSYPFVFARDGEVWMVPESAATGTVDLYRATRFPGGWVHEAMLVAGVEASDATLVEAGGTWWMFATVRAGGGSSSDALHLWSAPDFRGPWTAHRRNPVLIDCASARPAGRMIERDGALWRPVQDCRTVYGSALGFARVDRLDDDGFAQTVDHVLRPGPRWPGHLLHTLSSAGAFEFIDGSAGRPLHVPTDVGNTLQSPEKTPTGMRRGI